MTSELCIALCCEHESSHNEAENKIVQNYAMKLNCLWLIPKRFFKYIFQVHSSIFEKIRNNESGYRSLIDDFVFLRIGMTFTAFHLRGKQQVSVEKDIKCVRGSASSKAANEGVNHHLVVTTKTAVIFEQQSKRRRLEFSVHCHH